MATRERIKRIKRPKIEGHIRLESMDNVPSDVKLMAYAFDEKGKEIGASSVDRNGVFIVSLSLKKPKAVEVLIGKAGDAKKVRKSSLYGRKYSVEDWNMQVLNPDIFVPKLIWWPWWPKRICISGHVRKDPGNCAVPFVKVEIFDVDRLFCLWPYIYPLRKKLELSRVARIEELLKELPDPIPDPFPDPYIDEIEATPIPIPGPPTRLKASSLSNFKTDAVSLGPQPEPPDMTLKIADTGRMNIASNVDRINPEAVKSLTDVTFTSRLAPWHLFPRCFYSRDLICTTNTNESGYFNCCFDWWPLQFRNGWFKVDWRPDIIIRVTQVIDGVEHVLYIDPISNTRWNVNNAHIDILVDDAEVECGSEDKQDRPAGTQAFFTRIGNDEVYWINQLNGLYEKPPWNNTAYGKALRIHAQFGDTLSNQSAIPGATAPYYYRLSYSSDATTFIPLKTELKDTRVNKGSLMSTSHVLGPKTIGTEPALFEIRDFKNYYWYNPDWIGLWVTANNTSSGINKAVADGNYSLRLEVFDSTGQLLTAASVDYRDGTISPPAVLPPVYPCDLKITLDNNRPDLNMLINPSPTGCGVIKATSVPPLTVDVNVTQANNHLYYWSLQYTKGVSPSVYVLQSDHDTSGLFTPVNTTVNAMPMLTGVSSTCAFSLKLRAWSNVRNGYGLVWYREIINAIAVEDCSGA